MEELHRTALTYYKNGSEAMKQAAREFYSAMDSNSDYHIGVDEYIAFMIKHGYTYLCSPKVFSQLCTINKHEKSEVLSFWQVLTIFYTINSGRPICDGCGDLVKGLFFTCVTCYESCTSFDVCPDCYHAGKYQHSPAHGHFLDNFALLRVNKILSTSTSTNIHTAKKMEELHSTAVAYYKNGSEATKQAAREFYSAMDSNSDYHIGADEYVAFMIQKGYIHLSSPKVFSQLCTINKYEKSQVLNFWQVLTIFYIINTSGRPTCDGCAEPVKGLFFTCVTCYESCTSFDVCPDCYNNGNYQHNSAHGQFLDNFALLKLNKILSTSTTTSNSTAANIYKPASNPRTYGSLSTSRATVVAHRDWEKWTHTLEKVELGIEVTDKVLEFAIAAGSCTIL